MSLRTTSLFVASASLLHAGPSAPMEAPAADPWITPTIDIRTRYEFADVDGFDVSHAFTFRERLGMKTKSWHGLSAFIEGEFSQAVVDDYNGGAPGASPDTPGNSVIADPETNELNRAWVQYAFEDSKAKFGRQRIIYNNAAFVGNVGWRNNEQTYDALSFSTGYFDGLSLDFAYVNQANRIFGSDADGAFRNLPGDLYFFNGSFKATEDLTLGAYALLMDFDDMAGGSDIDNDTFGISAKSSVIGLDLYGEIAYQDGAGSTADEESIYAHATIGKKFGDQNLTLGYEYLGAGVKTPLATGHAFNGFSDVFLAGRTFGTHNGLGDLYLSHAMPIFWGMKWVNTVHAMNDDSIGTGYGWEYDSVLVKKFSPDVTAIAKFAYFDTDGDAFVGTDPLPTTTRFSIEVNYKF